MLKLFYAPHTRATRPRWLLEELGVPYQLVKVDLRNPDKSYFSIHPHGAVPALEDLDEGLSLIESGAICAYLADRFPEKKLAPRLKDLERGLYYGWLFYATATLEPTILEFYEHTDGLPEKERSSKRAAHAREKFNECAQVLEAHLAHRETFLKSGFSAADVMMGSMLAWAVSLKLADGFPSIKAYVNRMKARPAFKRSRQD